VCCPGRLQNSNAHIKKDLQALHISAARQVDVAGGRQAIIVFVPYKLLKGFRKIQKVLVEELEKKFRWARAMGGSSVPRTSFPLAGVLALSPPPPALGAFARDCTAHSAVCCWCSACM
jgi:hypothetical protein